MDGKNAIEIEYVRAGRNGTVTLTVNSGGSAIFVDTINVTKDKQRKAFAAELCKGRDGIKRPDIETELLRIAAELARTAGNVGPQEGAINEIDVSRVVRPERFITSDFNGLTVPAMTLCDDKPAGRWLLYFAWADGRRERRAIESSLETGEGNRIWIWPQPADPMPNTSPGWSSAARNAWLDGAPTPRPADVFCRVCERIAHYIDFPQEYATGTIATLGLWTMLTYCYPAWDAVPYLYVGGPLGSGKSRVFEILLRLAFRGLSSSNLSAAALFRTLHNQGGTLLYDEAERLRQTNAPDMGELLSMLLAGYKRGGSATRLEPIGDTFRTVSFDVYGPKALACIAGLPASLASRCIHVTMFRAPPGSDKPRRRIDADAAGWQAIRDDLHALTLGHGATWLDLARRTGVCPEMAGRDFELWQPLMALADWIQADGARGLLAVVQEHARRSIDNAQDDQTPDADEILLRSLAGALLDGETPTAGEILEDVQKTDPVLFKNWSGKGVSVHLKRYGLTTSKSCGRKIYKHELLVMLRQVQTSYSLDLGIVTDTTAQDTLPDNVP